MINMLSLQEIIDFLEPNQEKIPVHSEKLSLEKNLPSFVVDFQTKYCPTLEWQSVPPIPSNSFLISVLYLFDPHFSAFGEDARNNALIDVRKAMGFQLDEKDLHQKFGYARKRKFKKADLQKNLFQLQKPWEDMYQDEPVGHALQQYLVDFFNINLIVLNNDNKKVIPILAGLDNPNAWKPTFFIYLENARFYPLVTESQNNQYFLISQNKFLEAIYQKFTKVSLTLQENQQTSNVDETSEVIDEIQEEKGDSGETIGNLSDEDGDGVENIVDDITEDIDKEVGEEEVEKVDLSKLNVKELQKMVSDKGISIWRKSEKTNKNIFKKKNELIEDLESK
jgi:thiol-disulfide isomerase/thioredoxin